MSVYYVKIFSFLSFLILAHCAKPPSQRGGAEHFPANAACVDCALVSSLTQYGITWTFASTVPSGQFLNGDYWVIGPVTVSSVSPGWDGTKNGSMLDPVPYGATQLPQGLDSRINAWYPYSDSVRATFPLTINGTNSLVSGVGRIPNKIGGAYQALTGMAVLTVLTAKPAAGSFRPPYVAGPKPIWKSSQVDYSLVPTKATPATPFLCKVNGSSGSSAIPDVGNHMVRINPYFGPSAWATTICPENNVADCYPSYEAWNTSLMALEMMLNIPKRQEYINRMVQRGIDNYGISLTNYKGFEANGGFATGYKWPILFGGILLNDSGMKSPAIVVSGYGNGGIGKFTEDGYTYYGAATASYPIGRPLMGLDWVVGMGFPMSNCNSNCMARDPAGVWEPEANPNGHGGAYRQIVSPPWVGQALAARLMGAKAIWNHDAFFDYVDQWVNDYTSWPPAWGYATAYAEGAHVAADSTCFTSNMWTLYR